MNLTRRTVLLASATIALGACGDSTNATNPITNTADNIVFTTAQISSLDSTARMIAQSNPGDPDLKSLVDSTLLVITAGIQAKRVDVSTNLTTLPMYFVGIHRAFNRAGHSSSTWTLVGMDDPARLTSLIEMSGFAENTASTAPTSVSGTIGTGIVNGVLIQVSSGGSVTQWRSGTGTASFSSDAPGAVCPGFTPTPILTCAIETMHVHFTFSSTNGSGSRQASQTADVDVPAMRFTYSL